MGLLVLVGCAPQHPPAHAIEIASLEPTPCESGRVAGSAVWPRAIRFLPCRVAYFSRCD
jgi:hypothetical protein